MSKTSGHARPADDWFVEPAWCVTLLFGAEVMPWKIYDPAAGCGTIPGVALDFGLQAVGSDILPKADDVYGYDFLSPDRPRVTNDQGIGIVCNPPYKHAQEFIERAMQYENVVKHAWLVQRDFPYSQRRYDLFSKHPPARIHFLSSRPSCPPGSKLFSGELKQAGGSVDYCWIVWERGHIGPTQARWLKRGAA
ncbi:MAG TPA: hypothetical protein VEA35_00475 [Ramlibacter sp.]|nr:hypothetical protein [Ramlibacter sp.]